MHVETSQRSIFGFSRSGKVYAFSPRTGELKWSEELGDLAGGTGKGNVCLLDDKVIFRNDTTITCIKGGTGKILWQSSFGNHYSGGITCSSEGMVACASDRTLELFDSETGEEIFRTKFPVGSGIEYGFSGVQKAPGRIYTHPVITAEGEVYVFTSDGVLWALKPKL
jgi:outer membrane protein assembly factor BamB